MSARTTNAAAGGLEVHCDVHGLVGAGPSYRVLDAVRQVHADCQPEPEAPESPDNDALLASVLRKFLTGSRGENYFDLRGDDDLVLDGHAEGLTRAEVAAVERIIGGPLSDGPHWSDGDPWRDWTLVEQDGARWAVYSRLSTTDKILSIDARPPEQVVGTVTSHVAILDRLHPVTGDPGYRAERQCVPLDPGANTWGRYPPHYVRGFAPDPDR